jgi:hypothetical protein
MKAHKQDDSHTRLALLEQSIININTTLTDIKNDVRDFRKEINDRFDKVDSRFSKLECKFDERFNGIDGKLFRLMFIISSSLVGYIFAKMLHFL